MKKDKENKQLPKGEEVPKTRRNFLRLGLAAVGTGALAGVGLLKASGDQGEVTAGGEMIKVLSVDGKLIEVDKSKLGEHGNYGLCGSEARKGIPGKKFVMVIDLGRCKNARKCVEACQHAHDLAPDQEWMKVFKMQDSKDTAPYWFPKPCFHCDNAPCVSVCPVDATFKRSDGITLVDSGKCIGCKYCMVACPYSARTFNWTEPDYTEEEANRPYSAETSVPRKVGTVGKCDFCPDMIRTGQLPHCVSGCPMGAIYFGDKNEDAVTNGTDTLRFSTLMKDKAGYRYLEHFGTEPNVYYLPPASRQFPFEDGLPEEEETESES